MANTHAIFEPGIMASTQLDSHVRSITAPADLDNGWIISMGDLVTGEKDLYTATAVSDADANADMWIVDAVKRTLIDGKYALDQISDVREFYTPEDYSARVRKLMVGDTCYVSATALADTPTVGQYVVPVDSAYKMAAAADLSGATLIAFKVISNHTFYVGSETVSGYKLECVVA